METKRGLIRVVPRAGIEPARGCPHWILNPARLPISPPRQPRGLLLSILLYKKISGTVRLSHRGFPGSTIGAKGLDFCVREGYRYIPLAISTGKQLVAHPESGEGFIKEYLVFQSQITRSISTSQLQTLLPVHLWPIKQIVFLRPSGA